jgi:NADPH-dependent glutamate synthase beta subunit-like oxidoreductase/Pyruvate/2-oxoacid:ferredoxin oxidoreductase delta subunit
MAVSKIDLDKCIGCGACVESCPMDVFRLDTRVEYRNELSPCSAACPLRPRQREYHDLLKMGMLDGAAAILAECHPMPAVTGRLCPHPCETDCSRTPIDAAVNINALEQFLGDYLLAAGGAAATSHSGRVAVIGSGPAGLSVAYFLAREGIAVTVFERHAKPGGLLRTAVPAFRLPESVLDAQIALYEDLGIVFRTGVQIGQGMTVEDLRAEGYGAVVAAIGAAKPVELSVRGGDAAGIVTALEFLAAAKADLAGGAGGRRAGPPLISGDVAVIGGGSVALDAARTAVRLGAERVRVICLERLEPGLKDSMLALTAEIDEAIAEGVEILPSRGVDSFADNAGRVSAVRCVECLSVRDEGGRFNPVYGDCVLPQVVPAKTVIVAIGQAADASLVPGGFVTGPHGRIAVDPDTLHAGPGLFAAGDAVSGASTVVEALAAGKKAAEMVARYLRGEPLVSGGAEERPVVAAPADEKIETSERIERGIRPAAERRHDAAEVSSGLSGAQTRREAERCLTCGSRSRIAYLDDCQVCRLCQKYCPTDAIDVTEGVLLGSLHGWNVVELGVGRP